MSLQASAFSIRPEIAELNKAYRNSQEYPILIVDRADFKAFIKSLKFDKRLNQGEQEVELTKAIMGYFYARFDYKLNPADAHDLIDYATKNEKSSIASPLFEDEIHHKMRLCIVLPADPIQDHMKLIKTTVGAEDQPQLFKGFNFEQAAKLMTTEELQLFTIYHELSHCMDHKFLQDMYEAETDPWAVHRSEAFAEVNALFLLAQRKGLTDLAYPRSLLRTAYTKIYGPFMANADASPFKNVVLKSAGSSYFLTFPMLKAQELITANEAGIKAMSLSETLTLSEQVVENYALTKFGNTALREYIADGPEAALERYQRLAAKNSKMFGKAYEELQQADAWMKSLDLRIQDYNKKSLPVEKPLDK